MPKTLHEKIEELANKAQGGDGGTPPPTDPPETPEVPDVEASGGEAPPEGGGEGEGTPAPDWQPNYKFKSMDKEYEIDEWARPFVTKDTQEKFVELYQKAFGLDHFKGKNQELSGQVDNFKGFISDVISTRDKDLNKFFQKVGLKREQVIKYVLDLAEKEDLPESEKSLYNKNNELQAKIEELEGQLNSTTQGFEAQVIQARELDLARELNTPTVASLVDAFDKRMGQGAFKQMVIQQGDYVWNTENKDLSAKEAVERVLNILGLEVQGNANPTPNEPNGQNKTKVVKHSKPAVIPNIGNSTGSQAGRKPKSIAELREMAKERSASG